MLNKIVDYLKKNKVCNKSGVIRMKVNFQRKEYLSFRVDAESMSIDWGDGQVTDQKNITEQFVHQYSAGSYIITIWGENITAIDMPNCHCVKLNVFSCETLEFINCYHNELVELDVSNCKLLSELHCDYNQLSSLLLGHLSCLFYLSCAFNSLQKIDVKGCQNLVNLYCCRNNLCHLDLSCCQKLVVVKAGENAFDETALLSCISTLKHKFNRTPGLLGINGMLSGDIERVRLSILAKGWCEI